MSHSSFLSDSKAVRDRGDWLVECYPKNPQGVVTTLRFSRRGTATNVSTITIGSDTIPAHTAFRKRLITAPTMTQSLWQPGKILSRSIPSFGSIKLSNADGGLDQYHPNQGWTWTDCRFKCFFCDGINIQSTIGKVSDGFMSEPEWNLRDVTIPIKGRESLFEEALSKRVFRGTSYMLELFGDRTVSYGTPAAVNLTGNMTAEGWIWLEALPTVEQQNWGWHGTTGNRPWRVQIATDGRLRLRCTIAGVAQGSYSTKALSVLKFYHFAVVISGTTLIYYIWDDDAQVLTSETILNAFTSATRDGFSGSTTYLLSSGNDATFKPWCDEFRVWNYARSLTEIEANRFRPLTSVPSTCVHRTGFDDGTGTTVIDSSATAANGTISGAGTSTWLWAHEGGPELAGTPKPDVYGERWGVKPVIVDPVRQGYCVAGGGLINDVLTYEGGNPHTMLASSANFRTYITTTPAAGQSLRYLARGLFKLGSSPTLPISAKVNGYSGGSLGYVNKAANIARDIVTRRGPKITDPTDIDTSSFTVYNALDTGDAICGLANYTSKPISQILDFLFLSGGGWWGYLRANTQFHVERFNGPSVTADYNFDQRKIIDITPLPPVAVIFEVIVKYRKNDVQHTEDQVSATIKSANTDWNQWTKEWQEQPATDENLRSSSAVSFVVETALQYQADARILADFLLELLKGKKVGWSVLVNSTGLEATMAETCTLGVTLQNNVTRYNLDNIDKFSILTVSDLRQQGTVKLETWGAA